MTDDKILHLILDSGAFIRGSHLQDVAHNLYSIRQVIEEIKDKETRDRLQCLPFELKLIEPDQRDVQFIIDFSKKTGDFASLSAVDIKVLALLCELQRQHVNADHESREPSQGKVVSRGSGLGHKLVGFTPLSMKTEVDDECSWINPDNIQEMTEKMKEIGMDSLEQEVPKVACMTVDYAMQNVILQLGLKVVAVDNTRVIKNTSHFVLRCFACFKITEDLGRKFCPNCGNLKTLKRVSVSMDEDGEKRIHINYKKPINTRGTMASIPMPKGGKHSNNPILVEDQPIPQHKSNSKEYKEKKLMSTTVLEDPAYVLRSNPFACHDVYSRASRLRTVNGLIALEARNPGVVRKSRRKK